MSQKMVQSGQKFWIRAGWASLAAGWLSYLLMMGFFRRSTWIHVYSGYIALVFITAVLVFAALAMLRREGGHVWLLTALALSPVLWYFFSVAVMIFLAWDVKLS